MDRVGNNSKNKRLKGKQHKIDLLVFLLIYISDALLFVYNSNIILTELSKYAKVFLAAFFSIHYLYRQRMIVRGQTLAMFAICFLLALEGVVHGEVKLGYVSAISLFLLGYCLFEVLQPEEVIDSFKRVMQLICIASLGGVIFGPVLVRVSFLPSIRTILNRKFAFLLFTNVPFFDMVRNYGPFTEPSRFQAFIALATILEIFDFDKDEGTDWKRILVYITAMITTYSGTAYASFAIIFLAFVVSPNLKIEAWKKVALSVGIIAIAVLLIQTSQGVNIALSKYRAGEASESYAVRMKSIVGGLRLIIQYPLFGTGFMNYERAFLDVTADLTTSRSHISTSTFLIYFGKFGIIVGGYYVYNLYHMLNSFSKWYISVILLIALFFGTSGISLVDSIFFNCIIYYRANRLPKTRVLASDRKGVGFSEGDIN